MSGLGTNGENATRDPRQSDEGNTPEETIVNEAKRRFDYCSDWETDSRVTYIEDIKFANADSDNLFQWSQTITSARGLGTIDERPCLTINKVRQHNLQIINDAKQNKPSVKIRPMGDEATYQSAVVYSGICEYIEYKSNAQQAYDHATRFQVEGGIGWWRVATDYAGDESFDQEIFIRPVKDPLTIYMDPDIREKDGSDAKYAFVFDDMTREAFCDAYPKWKDSITKSPLGATDDWVGEDKVRVAEYWRVTEKTDKLVAFANPMTGESQLVRRKELDKELYEAVIDDPETKLRDIVDREVEWFLIAGDRIIEKNKWPGKYIPLVRVIGEETIIEGKLDRKGHTRAMKDPQRMYNYWTSAAVEQVALQTKVPYVAAAAAIEGLEPYWETANTVNHAVLPYNHMNEAGQPIPPPERPEPPNMSTAYIEGMKIASEEIKEVTGQYQAELGMEGNEKSGVAIQQRQRQGDNATYHYIDNLAVAIKFTGKILIDLIPKIFDTPRVMKIMGDGGIENTVTVDTKAPQAYAEIAKERNAVKSIFNPTVGKYDVEAEVGPDNGTQRQETFLALTKIFGSDPDLMKIAGDIYFRNADFKGSDELAERMKRAVPPQILGEGPSPQLQQAQQAMQKMTQEQQAMQESLRKMSAELVAARARNSVEQQQKEIDRYKAVTERMKVIYATMTSPADRDKMIHDLMMQEHETDLGMLADAHSAVLASFQSTQDHSQALEQQAQAPQPQAAE